jgi:DNA-binding winged helix-turn-helix (wHTH) protein
MSSTVGWAESGSLTGTLKVCDGFARNDTLRRSAIIRPVPVVAHRFGAFVLDSQTRELLRDGVPMHLSPKAFQLLELLVANAPRAMSKNELQDTLWPGVFVIEANLQHLVGEVRAALGDEPRRPRFIRTVHRFGYAFKNGSGQPTSEARAPLVCRVFTDEGRVTLGEGEHLVGRDPDAAVTLDSATVSRRHARIRVTGSEVTVEDLGSRNGSFVQGEPITGVVRLADGDILRFGRVAVRLRVYSPRGSTRSSTAG